MKKTFTKATLAALAIAISGAAKADLYYTDFNELEPGIALTDQIDGVTVGLLGSDSTEGPMTIAISNKRYGAANGIALRPSTHALGLRKGPWFDLVFDFDTPTDYFSILSLDSDEPVSAFAYLGNDLVDLIEFRRGSNFQVWELELGGLNGDIMFDRVVVDIVNKGSGYAPGPEFFDNLTFNHIESLTPSRNAIPTPGAFTLFATSGLIAMRRRRIEA